MSHLLGNRIAIVTGAGRGLGRSHAITMAREGAKVLVNDLYTEAAQEVVREIEAEGGEAIWNSANVQDPEQVDAMAAEATSRWGQIDILVGNAGILRDRTFAKADLADFELVLGVHLMGSIHCARAVWKQMKERGYGRIILTTSSSGLFGNFGQTAYAAAKMGLVGLMRALALEGARYGICANCIAPSAATQMTSPLFRAEDLEVLDPARVSPGVVALASEKAPNGSILLAGGGSFKLAHITMTKGIYLADEELNGGEILAQWSRIADRAGEVAPTTSFDQYEFEVSRARAAAKQKR